MAAAPTPPTLTTSLGENMIRKISSIAALALLIHAVLLAQPVCAGPLTEKENRLTEKVKAGINKLGTGRDARVEIKLRDKKKIAGFIHEISDSHFAVTDLKTGETTVVAYASVTQVKGHNLSTGQKVLIGVLIVVAALAALALIGLHYAD